MPEVGRPHQRDQPQMPMSKRANLAYERLLLDQGVMCRASKTHTVVLKTIIQSRKATKIISVRNPTMKL